MRKTSSSMSPQDRIVVMLIGVTCVLILGGITGAPLILTTGVAMVFIIGILLYGRFSAAAPLEIVPQSEVPADASDMTGDFLLAEGLSDAILTIGSRGQIIYGNPAAQKMFGFGGSSVSYTRIIRQPEVAEIIEEALYGNTPDPVTYAVETPVNRHIQAVASPIKADSRIVSGQRVLLIFHDITDLVISNTLRSDFLANASHELKTPIASILGYIETLRGHARDDAEARDRFLIIMQEQAQRMQRLISDLLSLRRIEQKEHLPPTQIADLRASVRTAMESIAPLAQDRKVTITAADTPPMPVIGDADDLVQLVLNLIDNAVKMSPPGSHVRIHLESIHEWRPGEEFAKEPIVTGAQQRRIVGIAETDEAYRIVRIRDEGPGFSREHLPRLGERFYRIAGDRASRDKGTGLGLAIVKHIVRRHRGGLFVESAPGAGTEFSIFIPAAPDETPD